MTGASRSSCCVIVVTGTPSRSIRCGRSRRSHSDTRLGKVETITSVELVLVKRGLDRLERVRLADDPLHGSAR